MAKRQTYLTKHRLHRPSREHGGGGERQNPGLESRPRHASRICHTRNALFSRGQHSPRGTPSKKRSGRSRLRLRGTHIHTSSHESFAASCLSSSVKGGGSVAIIGVCGMTRPWRRQRALEDGAWWMPLCASRTVQVVSTGHPAYPRPGQHSWPHAHAAAVGGRCSSRSMFGMRAKTGHSDYRPEK
jgi:hypothetical protein